MIRIAHCADLHIRGLSRHDEMRTIVNVFVSQVKEKNVDHILVAGDIFHTKTQGITPEYIDFMQWCLSEMASAAELHLILGNHDGNLVNLSRMDAISPIVSALNNPRIHLYKESGVYEFADGYFWCVFSLFDKEGWPHVKPVPGKVNIACYHGPVSGAHTESNWLIDKGLDISHFKDYDFTLLGDIHAFQFLDHREIELMIDEKDFHLYPDAEILSES